MKGVIALALLVGGVCLAATSGSLLGTVEGQRSQLTAEQQIVGSYSGPLSVCEHTPMKKHFKVPPPAPDLGVIETYRQTCRAGAVRGWDESLSDSELDDAELAVAHPTEMLEAIADIRRAEVASAAAAEPPAALDPGPRFMQWFTKGGVGWLLGLVLVVAGAVLGRRAAYERATAPSVGATATPTFDAAVATLLAATEKMQPLVAATADGDDCPAARSIIEDMESNVLAPVVDERDRYKARDGIAVFAEYFGPFSAGERNLARAWSSLTDGYPHVAADALVAAKTAFEQAAAAYAKRSA